MAIWVLLIISQGVTVIPMADFIACSRAASQLPMTACLNTQTGDIVKSDKK